LLFAENAAAANIRASLVDRLTRCARILVPGCTPSTSIRSLLSDCGFRVEGVRYSFESDHTLSRDETAELDRIMRQDTTRNDILIFCVQRSRLRDVNMPAWCDPVLCSGRIPMFDAFEYNANE
jgi:hypothetical protein